MSVGKRRGFWTVEVIRRNFTSYGSSLERDNYVTSPMLFGQTLRVLGVWSCGVPRSEWRTARTPVSGGSGRIIRSLRVSTGRATDGKVQSRRVRGGGQRPRGFPSQYGFPSYSVSPHTQPPS